MSSRISEKELILPALWCMNETLDEPITTTQLQESLRQLIKPTGEDLTILAGRHDDKFSQKVRNLRSHETLESLGLAHYHSKSRNGRWEISEHGKKFLQENNALMRYLFTNDFNYEDVKSTLSSVPYSSSQESRELVIPFDENLIIYEGITTKSEQIIYQRSTELTNMAVEKFTNNGEIVCTVCEFNFKVMYGPLGDGYIEIHHVKPICCYEGSEQNKMIFNALQNVVPLCSNCHRMVHRKKNPLSINELKQITRRN